MAQNDRKLPFAERIASSKAGAWYFINVSSKLDPWVLKKTDGRVSTVPGAQVLLLQHVGAKSGAERETPLVYALDGDDYDRAWEAAVEVYGGYDVYQHRAGDRRIPLFRLSRVD